MTLDPNSLQPPAADKAESLYFLLFLAYVKCLSVLKSALKIKCIIIITGLSKMFVFGSHSDFLVCEGFQNSARGVVEPPPQYLQEQDFSSHGSSFAFLGVKGVTPVPISSKERSAMYWTCLVSTYRSCWLNSPSGKTGLPFVRSVIQCKCFQVRQNFW